MTLLSHPGRLVRSFALFVACVASAALARAATPPVITVQPVATTIAAGATLPLFVTVDPTSVDSTVAYQWYYSPSTSVLGTVYGPAQIGGTTSYAASATAPAPQTGYYWVDVAETTATTESAMVFVTVTGSTPTPPTPTAATAAFTQPTDVTIATAASAVFTSGPTQAGVNYQWYLNGTALADSAAGATGTVILGSTTNRLLVEDATAANAGSYTVELTGTNGTVTSSPAKLVVESTTNPGRLTNLSCRASVGVGDDVLIAGFVVGGTGTSGDEGLLIRASGPALTAFGITGELPDPTLSLYSAGGALIATDTGWAGNATVSATAARVGAFAWTSPTSADSALVTSLAPGSYTAEVSGASLDTGVALVEIYDTTPAGSYTAATPRLVNASARMAVGAGEGTLIVGLNVGGTTDETVLIRASGPALYAFGVTDFLDEPQLNIYDASGNQLATNSGLQFDAPAAAVSAQVGAFSWGGVPTRDTAILITLPPGSYTAQLAAADGTTGVSLVEVYEVQ